MRLGLYNSRKGPLLGLLPLLKLLPPEPALRFVSRLGASELLWNVPLRRRFLDAVERAEGRLGARWDRRAVAGALAGNHLRWRARDYLLDRLPDDRAERLFSVAGRDDLDAALARGKGVLLLFNHFGAFLMPAHWLVRHGYPLRWFTERPRNISRMVQETFRTDGPLGQKKLFISRHASPSEGGSSIRRAVRVLKAGLIVQVAGDVRWTGPRTAPATFLGRRYSFTTTWITLAAISGAPVVPAFGLMDPDGSYRIEFEPAFDVPPEAAKGETASYWIQSYLDRIEARILRRPENSGDYLFWDESDEFLVEPAA